MAENRRLILRNFLSHQICKELEFIHKSCCTVGYRPNVSSTTLSHLIATNSPHLIMPFVPIRAGRIVERLKEKVEEYFGCEYELFVEFTGLISWSKGASIGWHSDDNRDHLKQRHFSVVCYLNSYEVDFHGGLFHFQDGEPSTIAPIAGDVIIYTADDRNIHSVSEVTDGERITLALWFSRDASHDEDAKFVNFVSDYSLSSHTDSISSCFPILASTNMYWFPPEEASIFQSGFNICVARLHVLGFDIYFSNNECRLSVVDSSHDILKLLEEPLYLVRGDKLIRWEFVNILHALQVVQFNCWKASGVEETAQVNVPSIDTAPLSESQRKEINRLKAVFLKDIPQVFQKSSQTFCGLQVCEWEAYTLKLRKQLVMSIPYWIKHQSIFTLEPTHNDEYKSSPKR